MSYGQMEPAFAGMKADSGDDRVESYATAAALDFGVVVTDANGAVTAGGVGAGITVHSHAVQGDKYPAQSCVSVMVQGNVWAKVATGETVVVGAAKFNAAGELAATGTTLKNAAVRQVIAVTGGNIAEVQLNVPRTAA